VAVAGAQRTAEAVVVIVVPPSSFRASDKFLRVGSLRLTDGAPDPFHPWDGKDDQAITRLV
jgi:hypothetical protein